ncbi:MAG: FHA domain-containing protein [Planctomycetota bacterium]|nr:FHA domain-containing protein [Planctomycetota bacterium]
MKKPKSLSLVIQDSSGKRIARLKGSGPWVIGRDPDCDFPISDDRASRRHAQLEAKDRGLMVKDLGSSNGTRLDGKTIHGSAPLPRGSKLQIGNASVQLQTSAVKATSDKGTITPSPTTTEDNSSPRQAPVSRIAPRPGRTRRRSSFSLNSVVLLLCAIIGIGFTLQSLMTDVEPNLPVTVSSSGPGQSEDSSSGDSSSSIPLPRSIEQVQKPTDTTQVTENKESVTTQRPRIGFDSDSKFDIPFAEPDVESIASVADDTKPEAEQISPPARGSLSLQIIDDAWPPSDRIIAYEYHQKDHHGGPTFIDRRGKELTRRGDRNRKTYRVIALEVANSTDEERLVQLRTPVRKDLEMRFRVLPGRSLRRFIAIEDPGSTPVRVEMLDRDGELLDSVERMLGPGHRSENGQEALAIAMEREREEWVREQFQLRPIEIKVMDDDGKPVAGAQVMLLSNENLAVMEGKTDNAGSWQGMAIPGSWTVISQGEIEDDIDPDAQTAVLRLPRVFIFQGTLDENKDSITLSPSKETVIAVQDQEGKGLQVDQIWVTPESIAQAFTTERVAREIGSRGRLESTRQVPKGRFRLLLAGLPVDVCVLGRTQEGDPFLLRNRTGGDREEVSLTLVPGKMGRLQYSSESAFGGAGEGTVDVISVDGFRERFALDTAEARRAWVMPGTYRLDVRSSLAGGKTSRFLPYRATLESGQRHDLEPRSPWTPILHYERKGKDLQMRLSLSDAGGRVLERVPGKKGSLAAVDRNGKVLIERELGPLRWQEPETLQRVDLAKLSVQIDVPFGTSDIRGIAKSETPVTVNDAGSSASGPSVFRDRMKSMMPEVARSLLGCKEHLGCADGVLRLFMDFDIFLPPGVGGLGGGGVIVLDAAVLHEYTGIGDILPGAYTHELGHNIGFGHDPYMLLADCGVDEGIYGELGYRLLNARAFQKTLDWLLKRESDRKVPWQPNPSVFAALRFFHGLGVHHKMFTERRASEQTLVLHGLSSIERIAGLYSLALGENVAWIFRANGWPVFDDRVDLGGSAVKFTRTHPKQLNYNRLDGTIINGWWVRGPVEGIDVKDQDQSWTRTVWPTPFTDLSAQLPAAIKNRRWLLFRRIAVSKDIDARLAIATDVKMQIKVNGSHVGFIDASAQMSQPMHDELMLNNKKPFPVKLLAGENIIEVAVTQPVGTRGFRLELMSPNGTPIPTGVLDEGPEGEDLSEGISRIETHQPLINGSFEAEGFLDGWITGEIDPGGSIRFTQETENLVNDTSALRAEVRTPGTGGIIQRIVVTPGMKYKVSALVKAEGLQGEALVGFFTGRLGSWSSRSKPLRRDTDWTRITFDWSPGTSRTTYIACYLKGQSGTVWFDQIELKETR